MIEGNGKIGNEVIKKGDNFIIPTGYENVTIMGNMSIMMSTI